MQQSNGYIIVFSLIMTLVLGGLLSGLNQVLKPAQERSEELDTRKKILGAVMTLEGDDDPLAIYQSRIKAIVVNSKGEEITLPEGEAVEDIVIEKEYKKDVEDRRLPVFKFMSESNPNEIEAYIIPVFGNGLWDYIWGFIALGKDGSTIVGAVFDHKGETPGLGARITDAEVQERFKNQQVFNDAGLLVSVEMLKGEGPANKPKHEGNPHAVDGLSGATITARGVTNMLKAYFGHYELYLKKVNGSQTAMLNN